MSTSSDEVVRYFDPQREDALGVPLSSEIRETLDTINRKIAAAESLDALVDYLFEQTRSICPCDRIGLAFLEDKGTILVSRWVKAEYEPVYLKTGYREGLAGSSLREVLQRGCLRIISDLEKYYELKPESVSTCLLLKEGVLSSMTCPLIVEGRMLGVMFRSARRRDAYDERQASLHMAIAERLSQAVEKAYRIAELTRTNEAYLEMLGFASHEIKSPLASIVMDAEVLLKGYLGELEEPQSERLRGIAKKAQTLLETARDYLDLSQFERGELLCRKSKVDFHEEVLRPVLDLLDPQREAKGMTVKVEVGEGFREVWCDSALMRVVLQNLVGNAVKYGFDGGEIRIKLSRAADKVLISVWNSGPGFPDTERVKLFKRFSRIKMPEFSGVRGSGVGLYNVWQIVQLHEGRITATSKHGSWAEFTFTIPDPPAAVAS